MDLTKNNTQRTTAANLATQTLEKVRAMSASKIPDGLTTSTVGVGGTTYTLSQTSEYVTQDGTACAGATGGDITSKRVTVVVTWPNMGNVKPVRSDTLRSVGSSDMNATSGAVAVNVQNASGGGTTGVVVTVKTAPGGTVVGTQTSGNDGCVVFANLPVGNYTATANTTGYVNFDGTQAASTAFGIFTDKTSQAVLPYDLLGGFAVTPKQSNTNFTLPSNLPITFTTSIWSPNQKRAYTTCSGTVVSGCVSGTTTRTATSLYPASYGAWAGSCADAAPASVTLLPVTSGVTQTMNATNIGLVTANISTLATGKHLYAVHSADGSCAAGEVYDFGVVSNGQQVKIADAVRALGASR